MAYAREEYDRGAVPRERVPREEEMYRPPPPRGNTGFGRAPYDERPALRPDHSSSGEALPPHPQVQETTAAAGKTAEEDDDNINFVREALRD